MDSVKRTRQGGSCDPGPSSDGRRRRLLALVACCIVAVMGPGTSAEEEIPLRGFTQIERVQIVMLQASVTDSKGRPVLGLTQEDFTVFDAGDPQPIEFFASENDAPIALAFLLDLSGSMRQPGRLEAAKDAINGFVAVLEGQDRFGLIGFADDQVSWITNFTGDSETFRKRLQVQRGYGKTALYDALAASPHLVHEERQKRKAIVLFTDGLDNASELLPLEAVQLARRVSVPIYTVHFIHRSRDMLSDDDRTGLLLLERFSRETGGALFTIEDQEDLHHAIAQIQKELRSQYVIGFYPAGGDKGVFRRVRLESDRSRLRIRTRTGYYPDS